MLATLKRGDAVWVTAPGGGERKAYLLEDPLVRNGRAESVLVTGEDKRVRAAGILRKA